MKQLYVTIFSIATASVMADNLTHYETRPAFLAAVNSTVAKEDFEGGSTASNEITICNYSISNLSNDSCFGAGQLLPGFLVTSSSGSIVALGDQYLDQSTTVVGAERYNSTTQIYFNATGVTAIGLDVFSGAGSEDTGAGITITAFDAQNNVAGTTIVTTTSLNISKFVGFISTVTIDHIDIETAYGGGELIDNLTFNSDEFIFIDGFDAAE